MRRWLPILGVALALGCRSGAGKRSAPPGPPVTAESVRGWWVEGNGADASGWWFGSDSVRRVHGSAADRFSLQKSASEGPALRLTLEGSPALALSSREGGGLSLQVGDGPALSLRRANEAEERDFEKRDARAQLSDARTCPRAIACCQAAVLRGLAAAGDCAALVTAKEIGQCARALDLFVRKALDAKIDLPACSASSTTLPITTSAPSP